MPLLQGADAIMEAGNQSLPAYVGARWRVVGLTSERGMEINGKVGLCVGFDPFPVGRLHIRIDGFPHPFKLKYSNILDPETDYTEDEPTSISDLNLRAATVDREAVKRLARHAHSEAETVKAFLRDLCHADRPDMRHRASKLLLCLEEIEHGTAIEDIPQLGCGECPQEALEDPDPFVRNLLAMKPPCAGNGKFSLSDLHSGGVADAQAARRLSEYPMSGFCVPCQIRYMQG